MEDIAIKVNERNVLGKQVGQLRRAGLIPAVLYGRHVSAISLSAPRRQFEEMVKKAGSTRLIKVYVDDVPTPRNVLLRGVQRDCISGTLLHVDLYEVSMTDKIHTFIPIVLTGKAPAVDLGKGVMVRGLDRVEVECLPGDLVSELLVDISVLAEVHDSVTVANLKVSAAIALLADSDEMIVTIAPMGREEEEITAVAAEEVTEAVEPTVIKKEKPGEGEQEQ
jgi:large subunit ribosomal protein L25